MANIENNQNMQTAEAKPAPSSPAINKNVIIIVAVVVFVFLLALVPILINVLTRGDDGEPDVPDLGIVLSGTYVNSVGVGSSEYTFDGDKVTNAYVVNGETVTVEYTYVIARENNTKVIKLTTTDENGNPKTTTHDFEQGKFGENPTIWINDVPYELKDN